MTSDRLHDFLRRNATIVLAYVLAGVLFLIATAHTPEFASLNHTRNLIVAASFVGLVAFGQTLCILTGGIDLSIPATVAGGAVLTGYLAEKDASRLFWIIPVIVGLAIVIGTLNGLGVAYASVPPIIMTLGMNGAITGLLLIYTDGGRASSPPPELVDFVNGKTFGFANQILIWLTVTIIATILLARTTFGRKLYAIGTNPTAALLAGVNVRRVVAIPYVISAVGGALTGVLLFGYLGQAFVNRGMTSLRVSRRRCGRRSVDPRWQRQLHRHGRRSARPHADRSTAAIVLPRNCRAPDLVWPHPDRHSVHREYPGFTPMSAA